MNTSIFADLDPDVYKTIVVIFVILLIMRFILMIINKLLDHKLKNKIIAKGLSEAFTATLLQPEKTNESSNSIKWFLILFSTGIGLFIISKLPIGINSLGIIDLCISLGFLAYYFYLRTLNK